MPFCEFGKDVKKKLVDIDQNQEWLIEQLKAATGMFVDSSYLQKILKGERKPQKLIDSIIEILGLSEQRTT